MDAVEISRRRLRNLQLSEPTQRTPDGVVRELVAMQSQDFGPAKWSIAQRCRDLSDAQVDDAIADGRILRTHVLRPTWHFVARDDISWMLKLTGPRIAKGIAPRLRELGLDARTLTRCQKWISTALEGDRHLTRQEVALVLERRKIATTGQRLPYILTHCELDGLVCSGRPSGKKQTYALMSERAPADRSFDREHATVELVGRYLTGHGPATVNDLRWWSSLTVADIKAALDALGSKVTSTVVDGQTLWWHDDPSSRSPAPKGAFLLQTYDEFIVGYRDSRFIGDARAASAIAAWRDRTVPNGLVLIGGRIAGHWRRDLGPRKVLVEAALYAPPRPGEMRLLRAESDALGDFLGRPLELHLSTF